jgi:hypothetical protein
MDEKRIEEQKRFYEIARQRAKELDVYMERFRRDIVEKVGRDSSGRQPEHLLTVFRWLDEALQGNQREEQN